MDTVDFPRFVFAFLFVLGLIALMAYVLKRYSHSKKFFGKNIFGAHEEGGRVRIAEVRYIDSRRRLVLIKRDDTEHLLLLADGRELVIESNIKASIVDAHE